MTYQLIYVSHAKQDFSTEELVVLLAKARAANETEKVSGLLLYDEHTFIQFLEGDQVSVEKIMDKIGQDPRHGFILYLIRGESKFGRVFPDWSMGFRHMKFMKRMNIDGLNENALHEVRSALGLNSHVIATRVLLNIINSNGYGSC